MNRIEIKLPRITIEAHSDTLKKLKYYWYLAKSPLKYSLQDIENILNNNSDIDEVLGITDEALKYDFKKVSKLPIPINEFGRVSVSFEYVPVTILNEVALYKPSMWSLTSRITDFSNFFERGWFYVPPEFVEANRHHRYITNTLAASKLYTKLAKDNIHEEVLRHLLPLGIHTKFTIHTDIRNLNSYRLKGYTGKVFEEAKKEFYEKLHKNYDNVVVSNGGDSYSVYYKPENTHIYGSVSTGCLPSVSIINFMKDPYPYFTVDISNVPISFYGQHIRKRQIEQHGFSVKNNIYVPSQFLDLNSGIKDEINQYFNSAYYAYTELLNCEESLCVLPQATCLDIRCSMSLDVARKMLEHRQCWIADLNLWGTVSSIFIDELANKYGKEIRGTFKPPCINSMGNYDMCKYKLINDERLNQDKSLETLPVCPLYAHRELGIPIDKIHVISDKIRIEKYASLWQKNPYTYESL